MKTQAKVNIIGAGLAGCECAYQLAKRGVKVNLYEQKHIKFTMKIQKKIGIQAMIKLNLQQKKYLNRLIFRKNILKLRL